MPVQAEQKLISGMRTGGEFKMKHEPCRDGSAGCNIEQIVEKPKQEYTHDAHSFAMVQTREAEEA